MLNVIMLNLMCIPLYSMIDFKFMLISYLPTSDLKMLSLWAWCYMQREFNIMLDFECSYGA